MVDIPAGMRNNNPLNIKYFAGAPWAGVVGPSQNTDQGDPQMVFASPQHGWDAAYKLIAKKYAAGRLTPRAMIAASGGWTPGNVQAAMNVARTAGIGLDEDIKFSDPAKAKAFMRALVTQEQGAANAQYPDAMIEAAIKGGGGVPLPASAAVVTGAGQSTGNYVSPTTPVPGATQPNFTPTGAGSDTSKLDQSLAGVFGDALDKASVGGSGGSSGGGSLPPGEQFSLPIQSAMSPEAAPGAAPDLSPLANLFALPTIGQPVPKLNIASKSWT